MADPTEAFTLFHLRQATGRMLENMGFSSTTQSSLDLLTDISRRFIETVCKETKISAENCGRTQPMLDDLKHTFNRMNFSTVEMYKYMREVGPIDSHEPVPLYPVKTPAAGKISGYRATEEELSSRPSNIPPWLPGVRPHPTTIDGELFEPGPSTAAFNQAGKKIDKNVILARRPEIDAPVFAGKSAYQLGLIKKKRPDTIKPPVFVRIEEPVKPVEHPADMPSTSRGFEHRPTNGHSKEKEKEKKKKLHFPSSASLPSSSRPSSALFSFTPSPKITPKKTKVPGMKKKEEKDKTSRQPTPVVPHRMEERVEEASRMSKNSDISSSRDSPMPRLERHDPPPILDDPSVDEEIAIPHTPGSPRSVLSDAYFDDIDAHPPVVPIPPVVNHITATPTPPPKSIPTPLPPASATPVKTPTPVPAPSSSKKSSTAEEKKAKREKKEAEKKEKERKEVDRLLKLELAKKAKDDEMRQKAAIIARSITLKQKEKEEKQKVKDDERKKKKEEQKRKRKEEKEEEEREKLRRENFERVPTPGREDHSLGAHSPLAFALQNDGNEEDNSSTIPFVMEASVATSVPAVEPTTFPMGMNIDDPVPWQNNQDRAECSTSGQNENAPRTVASITIKPIDAPSEATPEKHKKKHKHKDRDRERDRDLTDEERRERKKQKKKDRKEKEERERREKDKDQKSSIKLTIKLNPGGSTPSSEAERPKSPIRLKIKQPREPPADMSSSFSQVASTSTSTQSISTSKPRPVTKAELKASPSSYMHNDSHKKHKKMSSSMLTPEMQREKDERKRQREIEKEKAREEERQKEKERIEREKERIEKERREEKERERREAERKEAERKENERRDKEAKEKKEREEKERIRKEKKEKERSKPKDAFSLALNSGGIYKEKKKEKKKEEKKDNAKNGGGEVWICPTCKVAYVDGAEMVGCDQCDDWYHMVCVGMFVAPPDDQPWFCGPCQKKKEEAAKKNNKRKSDERSDVLFKKAKY